MDRSHQFQIGFQQLKSIPEPFAERLSVQADTAERYMLETPYVEQWKKLLFFGGVQIKKSYVSYHLMPIYAVPTLLDGISPQLNKRVQGTSGFNFTKLDREMTDELAQLTQRGFETVGREYQI